MSETMEKTVSKAETEFTEAMAAVRSTATPNDVAAAAEMGKSGRDPSVEQISAAVAAVLFTDHNGQNRSLSYSRVYGYKQAMLDKEWKLNHQGLAFYEDGKLADGQHRVAAVALSGTTQPFQVSRDFDPKAIDTIDRSTRRSAGEALEMMGISQGKDKASIGKTAMEYTFEVQHGGRPTYTDQKVEAWVIQHDGLLDEAIKIGTGSLTNVTDACLNWRESATLALLLLLGGWPDQQIVGFLSSVQTGVATYPESPTVVLSKLLMRAKIRARRTDVLSKKQKLALALKAMHLWAENASVARLNINLNKENLPTNVKHKLAAAA